ncbi:MAG TPA: hypothetical protein VF600_02445 [Abditibacteriaceae bacterium]
MLASVAHAQSEATNGTWAFTPPRDEFSADALLDLRYLNEKVAGQSGFVRRSADGNDFVLGNGKPARFWSILSFYKNEENPEWSHHARWLAKRGVNLVRLFGDLFSDENSKLTDIRIRERDKVWRSVAAFKKEGIYTSYMPFWSHVVSSKHLKSWGIPGDEDQSPSGLLFFDTTMQSGYKSWLKQMFDTKNPYTGLRLADDASLAIIELQNEDSLLFWTAQGIKGQQLRNLEKLYGDFLIKKYGSLDKASATWLAAGAADLTFQEGGKDDFAQGRAGLYITWQLTQPQTGYKAVRLADQLQFLGETMRNFNAEMVRYLRQDLGCKQLINAGNWKTADPVLLNDVERWSYTVGDVISVNRYYTGIHNGPRAGWSWDVGDTFTHATALLDPRSLPLNMKQVAGFPNVVSESGWIAPSKYQTEGPFLTAAYGSLTGVDTVIPQSIGSSEWQNSADGKWHQGTPQTLGQFPAAALMFRNGYIKKGAPVVHEERTMADLWNRRDPLIAEDKSFDPNRDAGSGGSKNNLKSAVNPLAFLVGPVQVKYGGDPKKTSIANLKPFINETAKNIRSNTGEINLDYGNGLCTVNTPLAQGATGFMENFLTIKLSDVTLRSTNEYSTISVVSMDAKPIRQSRKLLVQVGTIVRPTGWQEKDATFEDDSKKPVQGKQIVAVGKTPFQITNIDATVVVNNPSLRSATLLDINGMAVGAIPAMRQGATFSVKLPSNAMYVVLR